MDKLAAPLIALLHADRAACAVEEVLFSSELPDWAPPQSSSVPKARKVRPVQDPYDYECWDGISW